MTHPTAVRQEAIERLHAAPWNPRQIKDERFKNLVRSIQADPDFLHHRPILATADGTIYAGNMRYRAAQHLGMATVPAIIEDIPEQLAKERALRDNAQWGEWTEQDLAEMIYELGEAGSDTALLGFDSDEIARLLASVGAMDEPLTDPDAVPGTPEEPTTKPGDLWLLGDHRVLCGDSTSATDVERLLGGAVPNLMVTDPPYGVEYDPEWRDGVSGEFGVTKVTMRGHVANDDQDDWRAAWVLFPGNVAYAWHAGLRATRHADSLLDSGFEIRGQIIWAKPSLTLSRGHYHFQHEPCWYAVRKGHTAAWCGDRKQTTLWEIAGMNPAGRGSDEKTEHGTQKPVECMARPIRNHEGDVYDPFLGSGTTLIACEQLGRKCYGMEIEPKYVDVIVRRWEEFTGRKAVLDGSPD